MTKLRIPILTYHALDPHQSPISLAPHVFEWQMSWLKDNEYHVLPLHTLIQHLNDKTAPPDKSVVLTFDDGFESVYSMAYPVLERLNFPATVFLVSAFCGGRNNWPSQPAGIPDLALLSWEQIREMDKNGFEFGAHTVNHTRLDLLGDQDLEREILGSKTVIEKQLEHPIDMFAYPYGRFNANVLRFIRDSFEGACGTGLGFVTSTSDAYLLERVDINYYNRSFLFKRLTSPISGLYLAARKPLRKAATIVRKDPWQ